LLARPQRNAEPVTAFQPLYPARARRGTVRHLGQL